MKFEVEGFKSGLNGELKVTPVVFNGVDRQELPPTPLLKRKTIYIYNTSDPADEQVVWVGGSNVATTTSGIPINGENFLAIDIGRASIYGITTTSGLDVRVLEIA